VVPQRTSRRIPGWSAAQIYELARAGLRRLLARFGGINGFLDGDSRRGGRALGDQGERLAMRRLRREGYRIVACNFRAAGAEIDIVAVESCRSRSQGRFPSAQACLWIYTYSE